MNDAVTKFTENAMNFQMIWVIITGVVAFMVLKSLMSWAEKMLAWWKFKGNLNIAIGSWLRFGTATGTADGQVISADKNNISVDMGETIKFIPTRSHAGIIWEKIKNPPDEDSLLEPVIEKIVVKCLEKT